jgi:hypothetical protein
MAIYDMSRATLRHVALVNRAFARPALDASWAVLLQVEPLYRLLKSYADVSRARLSP